MVKARSIADSIKAATAAYQAIAITGMRQSGKTTLVKALFPHFDYLLLEDEDVRIRAADDPRAFLNQGEGPGLIIDEAQHVPSLFSYLQGVLDGASERRYVLTGSQSFLLHRSIGQSLAGRIAIFDLLPFSLAELAEREELSEPWNTHKRASEIHRALDEVLFSGFLPRIHDQQLEPQTWLRNYYRTYLERDVRSLSHVGDLDTFSRFVSLCAGRCGQILDLTALGADAGVSQTTAKRWLSALVASYQVFLLQPYHRNFNKRIIKRPRLYFFDSGLLCYLLRIRSPQELSLHSSRGAIFESFVISDFYKKRMNGNRDPDLYFWRDSNGREIDLIIDGTPATAIEIKSGQTIASDWFKHLRLWSRLAPADQRVLIHGGASSFEQERSRVMSWQLM